MLCFVKEDFSFQAQGMGIEAPGVPEVRSWKYEHKQLRLMEIDRDRVTLSHAELKREQFIQKGCPISESILQRCYRT